MTCGAKLEATAIINKRRTCRRRTLRVTFASVALAVHWSSSSHDGSSRRGYNSSNSMSGMSRKSSMSMGSVSNMHSMSGMRRLNE